jgi:hypothetical protein
MELETVRDRHDHETGHETGMITHVHMPYRMQQQHSETSEEVQHTTGRHSPIPLPRSYPRRSSSNGTARARAQTRQSSQSSSHTFI